MKQILSAKTKRMGKGAIFIFGLIVLGAMVVRLFRSGAKSAGEYVSAARGELKGLTRLSAIALIASVGVAIVSYFLGGEAGIITAVTIGTLTTGAAVVTTFNTTYLPKWFSYTAATQLTGVKITVQGDGVVFDSDAAGLTNIGTNRQFGQTTNTYLFTVANGFIAGKNVIWEFTNSAAQTPAIYVSSDETPNQPLYLQYLRQAVLANSGQNFTDFATLGFPAIGATDQVNVLYNDGTQQQLNRVELQYQLGYTQNILSPYLIDNFAGRVKLVNIIAAAAQTAYVQRWVPAIGGGMINQSVNN
jgi:hypothetical protein